MGIGTKIRASIGEKEADMGLVDVEKFSIVPLFVL